jgi:uncharacterized protein (TIGR02145 family)
MINEENRIINTNRLIILKKKFTIWIHSIFALTVFLILTSSCKKDNTVQPDIKHSTVTDGDGNIYGTVIIGTQVWLTENLKTTKYRNGDLIATTTPAELDINEEVAPKYQWAYEGDEDNVSIYGRLYTWYAITDTRHICPAGWHVPSDAEWLTLENYLGGYTLAGGKLKETGTTHWITPNDVATNETGFTALPGGWRNIGLMFVDFAKFGGWWSSTENITSEAFCKYVSYKSGAVYEESDSKKSGIAVRCLKDK